MASKSKMKRLAKRKGATTPTTPSDSAASTSGNTSPTSPVMPTDGSGSDASILLGKNYSKGSVNPDLANMVSVTDKAVLAEQGNGLKHLVATGILASHPGAPDIRIEKFSVSQYGLELVEDTELVLNKGQRYGLIGLNGAGKCWGKGTGILKYDGTICPVEDLKFDELVMGDDGTPRRIISEPIHGKGQMYRITPSSQAPGRSFSCNDEHILVLRLSGESHIKDSVCENHCSAIVQYMQRHVDDDGDVIVMEKNLSREYGPKKLYENFDEAKAALEIALNDLSQRDDFVNPDTYIWEVRAEAFFEKAAPAIKNRATMYMPGAISFPAREGFLRRTLQEVLGATPTDDQVRAAAYLLGSWLGNGDSTHPHIYVVASEEDQLKALHHAIEQLGCMATVSNCEGDDTLLVLDIKAMRDNGCNTFLDLLHSLNLCDNKHIAEDLALDELVNVRYHLLAGLLDTEGHFDPAEATYEFAQERKHITEMVHRIANNSGFRCNDMDTTLKTATNGKCKEKGEYWQCRITGPDMSMLPISIPRKRDPGPSGRATKPNKSHLQWGFTVTKLDRSEEEDYYGFTIDGNNRLLLADNTVTHNTSMMTAIGRRLVPIPPHISVYLLEGAHPASDMSAVGVVANAVEEERVKLESELEEIESMSLAKMDMERADWISTKLDALISAEEAKAKASEILHGLGFTVEMQQKATKDFSGGWRMRISLACALLLRPDLLLLDEPTNHLDLEACVWLEEYLRHYEGILVVVSHSQDLMNVVCTSIMLLRNKKLSYYTGDYDTYVKTREELEINQMKQYQKEQEEIKQMKDYIARFGHGSAKLAKQAKSKEKTMARMIEKGLTEKVTQDKVFRFRFPPSGPLPVPIMQLDEVAFNYPKGEELFEKVNLSVDLESRVAIVGKNGSGKSTLLKLMLKQLQPTRGSVMVNGHLRIGYFHQHLTESLPGDKSALEFLLEKFPDEYEHNSVGIERFRSRIGPYLQGKLQTAPISTLSDGQKVRIAFCFLSLQKPHLLLLDEPTNNLDMESIDSLAEAIHEWDGGVVLVSHDFRLLEQCCDEIWECKDQRIKRFDGDIFQYKEQLKKDVLGF